MGRMKDSDGKFNQLSEADEKMLSLVVIGESNSATNFRDVVGEERSLAGSHEVHTSIRSETRRRRRR